MNREIKRVTQGCEPGIGFDDTFKADNHILCIVSRANGMISRMVRNPISREANIILKIYKILIRPHIEYGAQAPVLRHGNWSVILRFEGI